MKLLATGVASRVHKTDLFNKKFENIDFKYNDNYKELHPHGTRWKWCREKDDSSISFRDGRQLDDLAEGTTFFNVK